MRFSHAAATTLLTLTLATASAWPAAAQTKKVPVGGRPTAGQSLRLNIVQDADLTMKPSEAAAGASIPEMHLKAKTSTVVSQKVGTPDEKGALTVDMTYDDITQDMSLNGKPAPPEAAEAAQKIKGKTLSMSLDANGELLDVTSPPDFPMAPEMIKEMLKQALGLMPRQELAVGETVTSPFAMAMPLPMPGDPPQLKGELKSTLTGLSGAPGNEIAALQQVVNAAVDTTVAGPGGNQIAIKMTVTGQGTADWDIKASLVKASKMTTQISGTLTLPGAGALELSGTTMVNLERLP
jgi:hypothetical protein